MSERVPMPCENCGRDLWIRLRNVGRIGKCKYCGYLFRARMDDVFNLTPSPPSRAAKVEDESRCVRDQEPTRELAQGRGQLVAKDDGPASGRQQLARERRIVLPQGRGPWSSEPFEPAPAPDQPSLASEPRWEAAHSPISEFRAELAALRDRADQVDHLKQRLRAELAEIEQIRAQLR